MKILSHCDDRNLGARNFDTLLMEKLSDEFEAKYGCCPKDAPRVRMRLLDAVEKTRKMLSGIKQTDVSIECLMEDEDMNRHITREEFEAIITPDTDMLKGLMKKTLADSKLKLSDLHSIEIVGDGSRIPKVQEIAMEVFGKDTANRTLNLAEAIARGCSLSAAMILPHFHVSNFTIEECNNLPADVSWSVHDGNMKTKTLFPLKNNYPSIKSMTFDHRLDPMDVAVSYNESADIVPGIPTLLSRYRIEVPKPEHAKHALKL